MDTNLPLNKTSTPGRDQAAISAEEERSRLREVLNNVILHLHPTRVPVPALRFTYTWGLGGIATFLTLVLISTGVLLMFRYDASVDRAYQSIQMIESQVMFGSLIRAIHHWSANILVFVVVLHLLRVFLTGSHVKERAFNWVIGMVLLFIVLGFNFTGYLLPWDQLSYWAVTVAASLVQYIPFAGDSLSHFLLGGPDLGQAALRNFYAIHVAVLPVLLVATMSYHFWKIRKSGGISHPPSKPGEITEQVTTIPNLVQKELGIMVLVAFGVFLIGTQFPAPLLAVADPLSSPNPAKAAWYFMGLQELLLHMDARAAMALVILVTLMAVLLPYYDRQDQSTGIYFRSKTGRWTFALGALLAFNLIPLLVIADEYWLEIPELFPTLNPLVANGVIPFAVAVLLLALVYGLFRLLRANRSEALLGLFMFEFSSLVALTIIGVFFRGANMALILPFS